ncbi:hypothetical protein JXA32_15895, partial [Candidatus Sumerlaeota bacterium]|nr:hypothetical protein [Candidatus Sumerlaeota bacterium]
MAVDNRCGGIIVQWQPKNILKYMESLILIFFQGGSFMKTYFNCSEKKHFAQLIVMMLATVSTASIFAAEPGRIVLQVDKPGAPIDPMFYGLMTEEINYSYDGGLYGELIQNRIFKNPRDNRGPAPLIYRTDDVDLFLTEHDSMTAFSCKIPNGKYLAKLYFAETDENITGPGQRVFSFNVQGRDIEDFDILQKADGLKCAYIEPVLVEVTDEKFEINFKAQTGNPAISAIAVLPLPEHAGGPGLAATAVRINAGASEPYTDSIGKVWQPETGFEGGQIIDRNPSEDVPIRPIANVPHWFLVTSGGAEGEAAVDTEDPVNATALT